MREQSREGNLGTTSVHLGVLAAQRDVSAGGVQAGGSQAKLLTQAARVGGGRR